MYLDYKTDKRDYYVIDIETDDLDATVIWVMCWLNVKTGEKGQCLSHDEIKSFFEKTQGSVYIGHNILKFDAPTVVRLIGVVLTVGCLVDTLVLGTLYSPSIENGHSLEEWGVRLGFPKGDFHDWSRLSQEMIDYCHQDVLITGKLFVRLVSTLNGVGFSEQSCWIQHRFTVLLERQRKNGFYFDGARALGLYTKLRSLEDDLSDDIRKVFGTRRLLVGVRSVFRKDGSNTSIYRKDMERYIVEPNLDGTTYSAYEEVEFSIGSPQQRTAKLLELGWIPEEFTPITEKGGGGNPKPFDKGKMAPSLERFLEENPTPEVAMMAKWMAYNGRANMINTWLNEWNEDDSCIHGNLFVADTLRLRHQAPNTANIPAVRLDKAGMVVRGEEGYFTYESRDLWCARPGRILVGTDASGLELRMLAHYLNRAGFTESVVNGDPHQFNADTVGITRPQAKTLIYAILYGAGDVKIARTLGLPVLTRTVRGKTLEYSPEGKAIKELFLERLGLKELIADTKKEWERGRIELVDGSRIVCPSPHAALNYKLQGGGARVMALAACLLERDIQSNGYDSLKVGDIHDEWQYDCHPDIADAHSRSSVQAIRDAGKRLNLFVPLDGEAKQGRTWAETH